MAKNTIVREWADISKHNWDSLFLGNGASIAICNNFNYPILHSVAVKEGWLKTAAPIFEKLGTKNFEHVQHACSNAEIVAAACKTPFENISAARTEARSALIKTAHRIHPARIDIIWDLYSASLFANKFKTIICMNYDLILYWTMLLFNEIEGGNYFKDGFIKKGGEFEEDWEFLRKPHKRAKSSTLVFYPHGNLLLARDPTGNERKITAFPGTTRSLLGTTRSLLETIEQNWISGGYIPLVVSEGTSEKKVAAICQSRYLMNVYERALPTLGEGVVVYGWSFDNSNRHVLDAILKSKNPPKQMAVSVFTGQSNAEQQEFCHQVCRAVGRLLPDTNVMFFDSRSPGCWNNSHTEIRYRRALQEHACHRLGPSARRPERKYLIPHGKEVSVLLGRPHPEG